jgi:hypothetical protein
MEDDQFDQHLIKDEDGFIHGFQTYYKFRNLQWKIDQDGGGCNK